MTKQAGQGSADQTGTEEAAPTTDAVAPTRTVSGTATHPDAPKAPPVGQVKPDPYWAPHDADKV